jgi:hypothetical protein
MANLELFVVFILFAVMETQLRLLYGEGDFWGYQREHLIVCRVQSLIGNLFI